jgi:hypothetical protein
MQSIQLVVSKTSQLSLNAEEISVSYALGAAVGPAGNSPQLSLLHLVLFSLGYF